jgi:hypothetical protein
MPSASVTDNMKQPEHYQEMLKQVQHDTREGLAQTRKAGHTQEKEKEKNYFWTN